MPKLDRYIDTEKRRIWKEQQERIDKAKRHLILAEMELIEAEYPNEPDQRVIKTHIIEAWTQTSNMPYVGDVDNVGKE